MKDYKVKVNFKNIYGFVSYVKSFCAVVRANSAKEAKEKVIVNYGLDREDIESVKATIYEK